MAKNKSRKRSKSITRKQVAGRQRDQELQRILVWGAIILGVVLVGVLAAGLIIEYVVKPNTAVAVVGETEISVREYQDRVQYQRLLTQNQALQYQTLLSQLDPTDPSSQMLAQQFEQTRATLQNQLNPELKDLFGKQVLDTMVEEELVRQVAAERGISVDEKTLERQVEQFLGYDRDAAAVQASGTLTETETLSPTETLTEEEYEERYRFFRINFLQESGLSEAEFEQIVEADLLRQELQEELTADLETEAEQVQVSYLVADTLEKALTLKERLDAGEEFEALTEEVNANEDPLTASSTLPWMRLEDLESQLGPELGAVALELPVGAVSEPVQSADELYYLLKVVGREVRPLDESLQQQAIDEAYNAWVAEQMEEKVEYLDWESVTPAGF
ncbi:MAG: peptidyl-prolyl cis-trans isomerase [Anaerolineales bacterium]